MISCGVQHRFSTCVGGDAPAFPPAATFPRCPARPAPHPLELDDALCGGALMVVTIRSVETIVVMTLCAVAH
jgi:hypothetical protein